MRQKSTVYSLKRHDPYLESKDELKAMKKGGDETRVKDQKQGQSEYRKKLAQRKKG